LAERIALVTGGGRGIGANVARALAEDGWSVVVGARTRSQVDEVAGEIGGRAVSLDVTSAESIEAAVAGAGPVELLFANAGIAHTEPRAWEAAEDDWWHTFEVNVRGVERMCRAVIPGMIERGSGRIVITGSGASYLPGMSNGSAYAASKAAVGRYGELLNAQLAEFGIPVFVISPGLVRTAMTEGSFADDAPWTPDDCAPTLVRKLATGRYDALAGRYLHAEHDDLDALLSRIDDIRENDLNTIRLRR
jgi:NAD(P)-dependent dehydrogenase (short-subunit alcohol dehydrogenase family)